MERRTKVKYIVLDVLLLAFMLWLFVSWVDVICHNAPIYGDKQYHQCNIIVMFADAAKK